MKKRIIELILAVIITLSFVTPFLPEVGIRKVYAKEESCTIYHQHTGSSSSGGGCYTGITYCNGNINSKTESIPCGSSGSVISQTQWQCTAGHIEYNSVGGGWYECPHGMWCGTTVGTRITYQCSTCNTSYSSNPGKCTAKKSFSLQCNKNETSPLATISCSTSIDDWTAKVILSANISVLDSNFTLSSTPYLWNGTPSSESTYTVTENGSYSLELADNHNTSQGKLNFAISNIDSVAPSIQLISFSTQESTSNSVTVKVVAIDEGGSGLADYGYSYNGGNNWVTSCENSFSENGNYSVIVKDKAGNQVSRSFTISNIVKPSNTGDTASTGNMPNTTSNSNSSPSNSISSNTLPNNTSPSSVSSEKSDTTNQTNNSQVSTTKKKTKSTTKNSKSNSKANTITKTPDSSVSGNSTRFVSYHRAEEETEDEVSTTVSESKLLATNDPQNIDTLSNNIVLSSPDNSLWSILFSGNIIKTILIVSFGTFLSVVIILFLQKKSNNYHKNPKH